MTNCSGEIGQRFGNGEMKELNKQFGFYYYFIITE